MDDLDYIEYTYTIHVAPPSQFLKAAAYRGEEMLEGLTSAAQTFFIKARNLYKAGIDRGQGCREMTEAERAYSCEKQTEAANFRISQLWEEIEAPAREYGHSSGTPEGDRFYAAVYGMPDDWRLKRNTT